MSRTVAIMQPTYLPWSGYFSLIESVDIFVILDTVQFQKRSWQQRNQIKTSQGSNWLTVPVVSKGKRDQLIKNTQIAKNSDFEKKHLKSMQYNYGKSKFFHKEFQPIFDLLNSDYEYLAELNLKLIRYFCKRLNIETEIIKSSNLNGQGKKTDLLCSICRELNASKYISPPGSKEYLQESDTFLQANIPILYFNYRHPSYDQLWGDFLPYMSIIDLLFNTGNKAIEFVKNNYEFIK